MHDTWVELVGCRCGLSEQQPDNAFPETVVKEMLLRWTSEGDWVFDPFSGFGTTAFVCSKMKRHCLGIERNPDIALQSETRYMSPSRLTVGNAEEVVIEHSAPVSLLISSAPFFHEIEDDDEAILKYQKLISQTLQRHTNLISNGTVIAIETVSVRRANGIIRDFSYALNRAMFGSFVEIDETVFICKEKTKCVCGMDHFSMKQFIRKK
jgi:hypothetical protein